MALINCPECGKEISDKSMACIQCGFPLQKTRNTLCLIEDKIHDLSSIIDELDNIDASDKKLLDKLEDKLYYQIGSVSIYGARKIIEKMCPVRTAKYERQSRTAVGHVQWVEYIAAITI